MRIISLLFGKELEWTDSGSVLVCLGFAQLELKVLVYVELGMVLGTFSLGHT